MYKSALLILIEYMINVLTQYLKNQQNYIVML